MTTTPAPQAEPMCAHPFGTTAGHVIPPTAMWAVKRGTVPVWYCPDCGQTKPRDEK